MASTTIGVTGRSRPRGRMNERTKARQRVGLGPVCRRAGRRQTSRKLLEVLVERPPDAERAAGEQVAEAAICRKVALARDGEAIEVWGDGEQTRSYCHVEDCVEGIYRLMRSDHREPLNLGQDRMLSINELVDIVAKIAGKRISKRHDLTKPRGVRGRNSDNTRLRQVLGWEPRISLEEGLARTYAWIHGELAKAGRITSGELVGQQSG
jgi:dTDP-D-glucose 4,6-dehydratase